MTADHFIIAVLIGAILYFAGRSLLRTWRGESGGCAGCSRLCQTGTCGKQEL